MTQQTALQNLIDELKQFKKFPLVDQATIEAAIEFAELRLPMEKEQSKQDYDAGLFDGTMDDVKDRLYKNAEEYYNETYNKE